MMASIGRTPHTLERLGFLQSNTEHRFCTQTSL